MRNRGSGISRNPHEIHPSEYKEIVPISHRKKCRTKNKVTLSEKIKIVHEVLCKLRPIAHVAKEYRIAATYVSTIVTKVKKKPSLLADLDDAVVFGEQMDQKVADAVVDMYKKNEYFNSVKYIQEKLKEDYDLEIKSWKLMHLLHHNMGMRFKKTKGISWQANDPKNLMCRHQFAQEFLKLDLYSKVILNVDETWLGMTDFRRRKWTFTHFQDSVRRKQVQPRISMIAGVDTRGSVYISLL